MSTQRKDFLNAPKQSYGQARPLTYPYKEQLGKLRVEQSEVPIKPKSPLRTRSLTWLHSTKAK